MAFITRRFAASAAVDEIRDAVLSKLKQLRIVTNELSIGLTSDHTYALFAARKTSHEGVEFSFISPIITTARLEMTFVLRRLVEFNNAEEMKRMAKAKAKKKAAPKKKAAAKKKKAPAKRKAAKKKVAKKKVAPRRMAAAKKKAAKKTAAKKKARQEKSGEEKSSQEEVIGRSSSR